MQTVNVRARYRAYVKTRLEEENIPFGDKAVAAEHRARVGEHLASGKPLDGLFLFMDYRDGNKVLARRKMNRLEAYTLNTRLGGTGFGWGLTSGY